MSVKNSAADLAVNAFSALNALVFLEDSEKPEVSYLDPDLEPMASSHKVYNFEVAVTHTYVADGIRVHNQSVLSFLEPSQLAMVSRIETASDGRPNFAVLKVPGSTTEVEVTMTGPQGSEQALFEVTTPVHDSCDILPAFGPMSECVFGIGS